MSRSDAGRIGALTRLANAPDHKAVTKPARDGRWQRYLDKVDPAITDPAERAKRAAMLRTADMIRMSHAAAEVRRAKAELRRLERELSATGLLDAGSDGVDADA